MDEYKFFAIKAISESSDPGRTIVSLAAAKEIGDTAVRAFKEGSYLEAIAWSVEAARNALDVLGRDSGGEVR